MNPGDQVEARPTPQKLIDHPNNTASIYSEKRNAELGQEEQRCVLPLEK